MTTSSKPSNGVASNGVASNGSAHPPSTHTDVAPTLGRDHSSTTNPRRTRGFFVAALIAGAVWFVTPASWLTVLYYLVLRPLLKGDRLPSAGLARYMPAGHAPLASKFWFYYACQEVPFSIYLRYLMRQAQKPRPLPKIDTDMLEKLLTKCLEVGLTREDVKAAEQVAANNVAQRRRGMQNGNGKHDEEEVAHQVGGSLPPPSSSSSNGKLQGVAALKDRLIHQDEAYEQREKLRIWFHYAPLDEIYADNVRQWLAWAFAGRELEQVKADDEIYQLVEAALEMTKIRLQWFDLKPGYNPKHKPLRLTIDPVKVLQRPLGHYVVVNSVTAATITWLRFAHGFRYEHVGRCSFLVKPPMPSASSDRKELPILFLHGLGIGIGQYQRFLQRLARHKDGVVIMIQPHISAGIYSSHFLEPPEKNEQAQATVEVLKRHSMDRVTVLSHSNGTMVHGWILRTAPEMCARNVLVDPVSFCLWQGAVCYAFVYRKWATFIEVLLGYFVAREVGVAHTIGRRFIWSDMCLWADELPTLDPKDTHFIMAEKDL